MILLITYALIAIFVSFLCSIWEAVLLSMPDSYVEMKVTAGDPTGPILQDMKADISKPLSAILSLNTIAHTVGAILVGKEAESYFATGGFQLGGVDIPFTGIVAAFMTLGVLLLSEIIPKSIGANNWKQLAAITARSLKVVTVSMYPLVVMSKFITDRLGNGGHSAKISREELSAIAQMGTREGVFHAGESTIINNLMRFHLIKTRSIMTPRTVVRAANQERTISDFYENSSDLPFSRIPVFDTAKDHITGYILKDVLLEKLVKQEGQDLLKSIVRPITVVGEDQDIQSVFNHLLSKREQIALVIDQFGGMAGIVTFEDVIETLLGLEIVDELYSTEDMQYLAHQNWKKRAKALGLIQED